MKMCEKIDYNSQPITFFSPFSLPFLPPLLLLLVFCFLCFMDPTSLLANTLSAGGSLIYGFICRGWEFRACRCEYASGCHSKTRECVEGKLCAFSLFLSLFVDLFSDESIA